MTEIRIKAIFFSWLLVVLSAIQAFGNGADPAQKLGADFTLTDQDGKTFRLSSARGKTVLANFIYTTCPDSCPLQSAKLARIQSALKNHNRDDFFLLSITTDPRIDTRKVLKSYARRFKADLSGWAFLTGRREELSKVWSDFGVKVKEGGKGRIEHTRLTTLFDRQGIQRIDYYGDTWTEEEVLKDIGQLAAEKKSSPEERNFDIQAENRKVAGGVKILRVKQGAKVTLSFSSDEAYMVYLNGYEIKKRLRAGKTATMSFRANTAGRFAIEWRSLGDKKAEHVNYYLYLEVMPS